MFDAKGTKLMTPKKARAIWAIYVWCRRTDELVDGPNASRMNPRVRASSPCVPSLPFWPYCMQQVLPAPCACLLLEVSYRVVRFSMSTHWTMQLAKWKGCRGCYGDIEVPGARQRPRGWHGLSDRVSAHRLLNGCLT